MLIAHLPLSIQPLSSFQFFPTDQSTQGCGISTAARVECICCVKRNLEPELELFEVDDIGDDGHDDL